MKLTPEQEKAVVFPEALGADTRSAVVTAAAGSGKTTLLVQRVIRILCDTQFPIPADKIAILTFTNNAADEFRSRMTARVAAKAKEEPDNHYISEQLIKFRSAVISTINAFCLNILRENSEAFGLPVNFSIIDEAKASVLKNEAMDKVRAYFYSDGFEQECGKGACDLLFKTFSFKNDKALFESVESIFDKTCSLVDPDEFLSTSEKSYSSLPALESAFIRDYLKGIEALIQKASMYFNSYNRIIRYEIGGASAPAAIAMADADAALLEKITADFNSAQKTGTLDALGGFVNELSAVKFTTFSKKELDFDKEAQNKIDKLRKKFKDCITEIKALRVDKDLLFDEVKVQHKTVGSFIALVRRFTQEYSCAKLDAGFVDFNDCERLLLNKLKSDGTFREEISARYRCIIIDEFQDTSDLQYEIFRLISAGENNLFAVGDIKQSIYAFRGGNPRLMLGLIKDNEKFETLPLNMNFRSRENVIDTVNAMFTGFMTEQYGDVDYNDDTKLYFGASYYPQADCDYTSELHVLDYNENKNDKDFDSAEEEANYTAALINRMIEERFQVMSGNEEAPTRDCTYGDFAILLRASTHAQKYKKALEQYSIPVDINGSSNYFAAEEISLILNMLKVIDNPLHDEELLNVIMSPIYLMDAEEVAEAKLGILGLKTDKLPEEDKDEILTALRATFKYRSLYSCLSNCARPEAEINICSADGNRKNVSVTRKVNKKCAALIADIESFRVFKSNSSIERLIRKIYDDTDFLSVIATYERSEQKLANIRLLLKYAADFENSGGGTLNEFIRYTDKVRENEKSFEDAKTAASADNSVKIMTFHKSKGLEMPIVILGQLGKGENKLDTSGTVVFNRNIGIGLKFVDTEKRYTYSPFGYTSIVNAEKQKQNGEELRLLYVAMTRAKEKLIMIGQCGFETYTALKNTEFSPEAALADGESIKWIISSILRRADIKPPLKTIISGDTIKPPEDEDISTEIIPECDKKMAEIISAAIQAEYCDISQTTARSKFTVTEIAHMIDQQTAADRNGDGSHETTEMVYISKPSFLTKSGVTGKEVGDAYHHAMEHFPLGELIGGNVTADTSYAEAVLAALNSELKLDDKELTLIKPERIAQFFNSPLGQRMLKSRRIEREYPIFAEVSAKDIYIPDRTDKTIVQGRADMFFYEDDGIVLVDYKSDSEANLKKEFEAYRKQLSIYKTILPLMTGVKVKEIYIYSFSEGKEYLV